MGLGHGPDGVQEGGEDLGDLGDQPTDSKVAELLRLVRFREEFEDHDEGPYRYEPEYGGHLYTDNSSGGCAPAHHPRRCHSPALGTGRRCRRWSTAGRGYCQFHGGHSPLRQPGRKLRGRYARVLAPSLRERLDELLGGETQAEQLELYEEIALARALLVEDIQKVTALRASPEHETDLRVRALADAYQSKVLVQLESVSDLCAKMARIEKDMSDKVSVRQLGHFVEQIAMVIQQRLGEGEQARLLIEDLRDKVRVPSDPRLDPRVEITVDLEGT